MHSLKCPVPDCDARSFQIVESSGVNLLVCDTGHVMSRDYSVELAKLAQEIASVAEAVNGLAAAVKPRAQS